MSRGPKLLVSCVCLLALIATVGVRSAEDLGQHPRADWPLWGGDWNNSRYSTLAQIDRTNIGKLAGVWTTELGEQSKAAPVVSNGLMFIPTRTQIYALNAASGKVVWTYKPSTPFASNTRGVALGEGLVFAGLGDTGVVAVRQATGELVWTYKYTGSDKRPGGISAAATYAEGVVIVPVTGGDGNLRCRVFALDAKTGQELWVFQVVPAPGDPGSETWPRNSEAWKFGGGAVWMTPSVDRDVGLVYVGTGNAVPQFGGDVRPGDNLYTDSVIALELKTGKLRWHRQLVHHDIWDYDLATPLILYDAQVNGRPLKAIASMRTDGYLFAFDRTTGNPIYPIEERKVKQDRRLNTSPTQPFPRGGDQIGPNCVEEGLVPQGFARGCYFDPLHPDMPNLTSPFMTMRFAPMAYSPRTRYFYATACVSPWWVRRPDSGWLRGLNTHIPGQKEYGIVAAIDSRTNKIAWQKRVAMPLCSGGGALTTASGLMFNATPDGEVVAYDAEGGATLWQFQTGTNGPMASTGPGSTPIVSYEVDGRQHLGVVMDRTVWALALGGPLTARAAAEPPPAEQPFTGVVERTSKIELATVIMQSNPVSGSNEAWPYEYGISPTRVRIKRGDTVTWTNTGQATHLIAARDGSWKTGTIKPGQSASLTMDKPGTYTYICQEHPWSLAELIVE